ncbi:hypothetical protein [Pedobacter metabolipauper]|uniref:Lipoprotein n=1 Tax=Pedobacter metabolipauper TaxID=425513 RepID=A0A4R6SZB6_9SPHI|nr:hypothetical protein [Pedobacter metabolipauper]TDQ11375.1 hypothetical protein ATK78_0493 [Pedobacter metabolipauper]
MIKKTTILFALVMVAMMSMQACKSDKKQTTSEDSTAVNKSLTDTSALAIDKFETTEGFNQPVRYDLAAKCMQDYIDCDPSKLPRTNGVKFEKVKLLKWLNKLDDIANVDSIAFSLGKYDKPTLDVYANRDYKKLNRITIFICPYFKGGPAYLKPTDLIKTDSVKVDPYNLGEIYP